MHKLSCREYPFELATPLQAYRALVEPQDNSCLLEKDHISFLGFDPIIEHSFPSSDVFEEIPNFPPCFGGGLGIIKYDTVRLFERLPNPPDLPDPLPVQFFYYRTQILFDHERQRLFMASASDNFDAIINKLQKVSMQKKPVEYSKNNNFECELNDEDFQHLVLQAKKYLRQGDIFQVVLSRTFFKSTNIDPLALYEILKMLNPSPYHFHFNLARETIVGASPEKLLSIINKKLETVPIAGTCPPTDALEAKLVADPKENAEHMMLVDLARNDIGRLAEPGSVQVKKLKALQRFSHVSHLVSVVQGTLKARLPLADIFSAVFPAGTLSGAPKIRAMEIIDELESSSRGLYGGAICFFDGLGNLDSCLAIRMAVFKEGKVYVRSGAGIVLDSDPLGEAMETRNKAAAMFEAIKLTESKDVSDY